MQSWEMCSCSSQLFGVFCSFMYLILLKYTTSMPTVYSGLSVKCSPFVLICNSSSLNRKRAPQRMRKKVRGKNRRKCVKRLKILKMVALARKSEEVHFHPLWFEGFFYFKFVAFTDHIYVYMECITWPYNVLCRFPFRIGNWKGRWKWRISLGFRGQSQDILNQAKLMKSLYRNAIGLYVYNNQECPSRWLENTLKFVIELQGVCGIKYKLVKGAIEWKTVFTFA